MLKVTLLFMVLALATSCQPQKEIKEKPVQVSGIYPQLAYYNKEGECGTGAVVPWADRLWVITYGPHLPHGSSDKLYEITPNLEQIVREESIGGTPANRMIHKESNQLFIGPYVIDAERNVRVIPYSEMVGRHTGNARHLTDPVNKIYYGTMEEGFYEVDVHNLEVTELYKDGNLTQKKGDMVQAAELLVGAHGKGLYSGQGVMVYSNNGEATPQATKQFDIEAGVLAEWDGKNWKIERRNQFVEITGPGGIHGNPNPETDPIWATGWDHKSVILGVRNPETGWNFFRLPKASHSYDGAHGWNTEWPRIRDVGTNENPDYLMTMHGMFWKFPERFTADNSAGIRPRSAYLKVIGDYTRWNNRLIFGCDDSAQREFLNKRKQKGNIEGPGQSNSNLWFTSLEKPDQLGPNTATGAVWLNDEVSAQTPSEPMLFAGWIKRSAWIKNDGTKDVTFIFEVDKSGNRNWEKLKSIEVKAGTSANVVFGDSETGEWIRVNVNSNTTATVSFNYSNADERKTQAATLFKGLAKVDEPKALGGLIYGLGDDRRALGVSAMKFENGLATETGYYELDAALNLVPKEDAETNAFIKERFAIPENVVKFEEASVLVVDDQNRRWRLPLGNDTYEKLTTHAQLRICREVATERDLFNCSGTFYELPAENADGFAKIRPVASHGFRIHDYASYRGLLVMTGLNPNVKAGEHIVCSDDGQAAVWVGAIDDLWEMGKPTGHGGPWFKSVVKKGVPSDPYLISHYDKKALKISHESGVPVSFNIEVEPIGHGPWMVYKKVTVQPGETFKFEFPENFQARWIRFVTDKDCTATTYLLYN
ncbi:hypothetical protein OU798_01330 [Prolixibacteraceae bacterium Z1-6]|uniref:Uncharacterized protein n=1 Tax=Draconibacterium aestuarii TaxID=2998507 RepID=A0A9X3J448_9BACT|nr:hypothetical protein [Prolixibacteraceae bacterium Z1-6]